ncbi:MAG: metallophosphoesterase [Ardenticatenaceae bacterium]
MNNRTYLPFSFVQYTDPQLGFGEYGRDLRMWRLAVDEINRIQPDLVLLCGDLVHDPYDPAAWQDFFRVYAMLQVPCYFVPGNHDIGLEEIDPELLRSYREKIADDYGTFSHKGVTFVWVNTQFWKEATISEECQTHDAWLNETLERAQEKDLPIIVAGHHPFFLERADEPDEYFNLPLAKRSELTDLFQRCGVRAYLSGHRHIPIAHTHQHIHFVTAPSSARNFDGSPAGFNLWFVDHNASLHYEFVRLDQDS